MTDETTTDKVGTQWRVSVPLFMQAVHGTARGVREMPSCRVSLPSPVAIPNQNTRTNRKNQMKKETAVKERDVAAEVTALRDGTKELGMECCPAWVAVRCGTMDLSESSDRTIAWRCPGSTLSEIAAAIVNLAETVPSDPDGISVAHLHLCVYVRNDALDSKGDLPGRCSIRHSSRVASDAEDDEGRVKIRQFAAGLVEKESRGFRLATVAELTEFEDAPGVITTGVALAS